MFNLCSNLRTIVLAGSLLTGCGQYGITKMDEVQQTEGEQVSADQWLSAWAALQAGNPEPEASTHSVDAEPRPVPQPPTTFASGVSLGAERDPRPTSNHRSGSRLRVRAVLTDEGQQSWVGWYDQQRDEACEFQRDVAGTLRCLPSEATSQLYFLDAECSVRVAAVADRDVSYALQREANQCNAGVRVHSLKGTLEAPTSVFTQTQGGHCIAASVPDAPVFRAVGDEVPSTEFVAALQGIEGTAARVKAAGLVAEDGAISVTGFFDSELQTPCSWEGKHRTVCVPLTTDVTRFADEQCSQPLLQPGRDLCAPDVTFGAALEPDSCEVSFYRPGDPFQGNRVYELTEQAYESREVSSDEAASMQVGVRISSTEFAIGNLDRFAGATTRLSSQHFITPDRGVWFSSWYDNVLEAECSFVHSGNGEWRCLPTDTGDEVLFADAACSQPITEVQAVDSCGSPISPPQFVTQNVIDADGRASLQVRRVLGNRPYLATVYRRTAEGCGPQAITDNRQHFDLTQPLPANSFVEGRASVL